MRHFMIALFALALMGCIAPDGESYTVATVDADNRLQVQHIDVTSTEEHYRGWFNLCLHVTAAETGYADVPGCLELTATAHQNGVVADAELLELWNWDIVRR